MMRNLVKTLFCACALALVFVFGAGDLLAQTGGGSSVTFTPIVEFGNLFDTIRSSLGPIVVGALGLGLAIWGARYMFGVIKTMGR